LPNCCIISVVLVVIIGVPVVSVRARRIVAIVVRRANDNEVPATPTVPMITMGPIERRLWR
jgi:hypothetical protein